MPVDTVDVSVTYAGGLDTYLTDEFTPGREQFGLLDADTQAFTVAVNFLPRPQVALGATYGYETFSSLQKSRNAAPLTNPNAPPPPNAEWTDPTRDWTLDNDEKVNTFTAYVDLLKVVKKTDIRIGYDFMDSNNAFVHGGPRIQQLNTNTSVTGTSCPAGVSDCFIPLPDITTSWSRFTADVKYFIDARVGIGFAYLVREAGR